MDNNQIPNQDYKVLVRCNTFNQSKYIEDALNGFVMQKTNFPFVCLVMDDCSTDGEQEVIKTWMERECDMDKAEFVDLELSNVILVPHKTNSNCTFAFYLLKRNTWKERDLKLTMYAPWREHCKYEALCEGDDYWTDTLKLQLQYDFMDSHLDCSMCFHDVNIKAEPGRKHYDVFGRLESREYSAEEVLVKWSTPTCSMFYKAELSSKIPKNDKFRMGDNVLVQTCMMYGKVCCIAEKMGVYRLIPSSWIGGQSHKKQRYLYISHYKGMIESFPQCKCKIMYDLLENQYFQLLTLLKREGDKEEFAKILDDYRQYFTKTRKFAFALYYYKDNLRLFLKKILNRE